MLVAESASVLAAALVLVSAEEWAAGWVAEWVAVLAAVWVAA